MPYRKAKGNHNSFQVILEKPERSFSSRASISFCKYASESRLNFSSTFSLINLCCLLDCSRNRLHRIKYRTKHYKRDIPRQEYAKNSDTLIHTLGGLKSFQVKILWLFNSFRFSLAIASSNSAHFRTRVRKDISIQLLTRRECRAENASKKATAILIFPDNS